MHSRRRLVRAMAGLVLALTTAAAGGALAGAGTPGGWSAAEQVGSGSFTAVSCPSASWCLAAGTTAATWDGRRWKALSGGPATKVRKDDVLALSCTGPRFCMAVDRYGNVFRYNGATWTGPTAIGASTLLITVSVSCASPAFCALVDAHGAGFIWNGRSWSAATATGASVLTGVSCPVVGWCLAVGDFGQWVLYERGAWAPLSRLAEGSDFESVSCASPAFCEAGTVGGDVLVRDGETWTFTHVSTNTSALRISCPTTQFCAAVNVNSGPPGSVAYVSKGRTWGPAARVFAVGMSDVACASAGLCAAVSTSGDVSERR